MVGHRLLWLGGLMNVIVAVVHVGAIIFGPAAYVYLGAPGLGAMEEAGSWVPDVLTFFLSLLFLLFAAYAIRTAQGGRPLPFARKVLVGVGLIYAFRGIAVVPEVFLVAMDRLPARGLAFSLVSLCIGLLYLVGTRAVFSRS